MRSILEIGWRKFGRLLHAEHKLGVSEVLLRDLLGAKKRSDAPLEEYIHAGYRWLCAAQDAGPDRGVAAYYSLFAGWANSYPETTGYIIPTFLEYARRFGDEEARRRALEMADWECEVQLASGAVQSGTLAVPPAPSVFNELPAIVHGQLHDHVVPLLDELCTLFYQQVRAPAHL